MNKYEDTTYKNFLNDKKNFKEFLRDFTDIEIFKDIAENDIDDQTERFVADMKTQKECDTLKMVKIKDAYALVLVEQQSQVNHLMPYRILEYMTKIWKNYIKEQEQAVPNISERKDFKLPPIIPIVYHTGKGNWTVKSEFKEKIEHNNLFKDFIPSFNYGIISLNKLTYDDLKQKGTAIGLAMMLMKTDGESDLKKFIEVLSDENYIEKINSSLTQTQKDDLKIVFERQLEANNVSEERKSEILESFNLGGAKMLKSWFDMQEIEKKGIEKGIEEKTQKIVFKLLERDDIDDATICELAEIDEKKLEELKVLYQESKEEYLSKEIEDITMGMM